MRWIVAFFALFTLIACGNPLATEPTPTPTCQQQAAPFIGQIQPIFQEWQDAITLAGNTPRASLSAQIDRLQGIRRSVQALQPPDCAKVLQANLVAAMDTGIQAYLDFLAQKPESQVSAQLSFATQQLGVFSKNLAHLQAGEVLEATMPTPIVVATLPSAVELIKGYEQESVVFTDSPLADGTPRTLGSMPGGLVTVEFVGPRESPSQASILLAVGGYDRAMVDQATKTMASFAKALMLDWTEADAWMKQSVEAISTKPDMKPTVTVGNRIVTVERIGSSSDQTLSLTIKMT